MSQQISQSPLKTRGGRQNMVTAWKRSSSDMSCTQQLKVPPRKAAKPTSVIDPSPGLVVKLETLTFNEGKKPTTTYKATWQKKNWRKAGKMVVKRSTQLTEPVEFNLKTESRFQKQQNQQIQEQGQEEFVSMQKFCEDYWKMTPERFLKKNSVWAGKLQSQAVGNARPPRLATSMLQHSRAPIKSSEEREIEMIGNLKPFKARGLDPRIYNRVTGVQQQSQSCNSSETQQLIKDSSINAQQTQQKGQQVLKGKHCKSTEQESKVVGKVVLGCLQEHNKENKSDNSSFKALPMPKFSTPQLPKVTKQAPVKPVPFSLATDKRHQLHSQNSQVDKNEFEFKAQPLPMTTYKPQQFQPRVRKKVVAGNVCLNSDRRAEERQQYQATVLQQKKTADLKKQFEQLEALKLQSEQLKEYRKTLEFRAQPMPDMSEPDFKPDFSKSQPLTVAVSPVLNKKKKRKDSFDEAEFQNLHQSILLQLGKPQIS